MLSEEDLARIVKNEIEDRIRKGENPDGFYYILLNRKIYPQDDYNKEVAEGKRSPNDIYAYVDIHIPPSFDIFLFDIDYLASPSVKNIVNAYLRKTGFTITNEHKLPPTPNLKYFIDAEVVLSDHTPDYLVIDIYDIDSLARTLHIPQIVEQKLGSQPREITADNALVIYYIIVYEQPLLAGHTYSEAWNILYNHYVYHKKDYEDEAYKVTLAYTNLFPSPYQVCYKWKAGTFDKIDCLKIELLRFSS